MSDDTPDYRTLKHVAAAIGRSVWVVGEALTKAGLQVDTGGRYKAASEDAISSGIARPKQGPGYTYYEWDLVRVRSLVTEDEPAVPNSVAPDDHSYVTATRLGRPFGLHPVEVNRMLDDAGLWDGRTKEPTAEATSTGASRPSATRVGNGKVLHLWSVELTKHLFQGLGRDGVFLTRNLCPNDMGREVEVAGYNSPLRLVDIHLSPRSVSVCAYTSDGSAKMIDDSTELMFVDSPPRRVSRRSEGFAVLGEMTYEDIGKYICAPDDNVTIGWSGWRALEHIGASDRHDVVSYQVSSSDGGWGDARTTRLLYSPEHPGLTLRHRSAMTKLRSLKYQVEIGRDDENGLRLMVDGVYLTLDQSLALAAGDVTVMDRERESIQRLHDRLVSPPDLPPEDEEDFYDGPAVLG